MEMSRKQAEFFAVIIFICTLTAAAILLIDFQIKGAILEQANRFRLEYEEWQRGKAGTRADSGRNYPDDNNDSPYPGDVLDSQPASVETAGDTHVDTSQNGTESTRTANPRRATRRSPVQNPGK